ncbi:MAG: hypothetical protein M1358_26055 [Chloroflexi bacterium]|nr:hypothetical protein [Chloroflexota bacterium]
MWPFTAKLTRTQESEVKDFRDWAEAVCAPYEDRFRSFHEKTVGLYELCRPLAQQTPCSTNLSPEVVESAHRTVVEYRQFVSDLRDSFPRRKPDRWYPKEIRKAYERWTLSFSGMSSALEMVDESLQKPQALTNEPGQQKINMFIQGLKLVAFFSPFKMNLPKW